MFKKHSLKLSVFKIKKIFAEIYGWKSFSAMECYHKENLLNNDVRNIFYLTKDEKKDLQIKEKSTIEKIALANIDDHEKIEEFLYDFYDKRTKKQKIKNLIHSKKDFTDFRQLSIKQLKKRVAILGNDENKIKKIFSRFIFPYSKQFGGLFFLTKQTYALIRDFIDKNIDDIQILSIDSLYKSRLENIESIFLEKKNTIVIMEDITSNIAYLLKLFCSLNSDNKQSKLMLIDDNNHVFNKDTIKILNHSINCIIFYLSIKRVEKYNKYSILALRQVCNQVYINSDVFQFYSYLFCNNSIKFLQSTKYKELCSKQKIIYINKDGKQGMMTL